MSLVLAFRPQPARPRQSFAQRWQPAQLADITPVAIPAIWWWVWRRWPPRDV